MESKTCTKCKEIKPLENFSPNRLNKDGKTSHCKSCKNAYQRSPAGQVGVKRRSHRYKEYRKEYSDKHKEDKKGYKLLRRYDITQEMYDKFLSNQNGKCAICGAKHTEFKRRLAVDHCHETGTIRGLLCLNCNTGLGKFLDSKTLLQNAINYLL